MINIRTWFFLYGLILFTWIFVGLLLRVIHLGRLQKKLLSEGEINHGKDWQKKVVSYHVSKRSLIVLLVVWIGLLLNMIGAEIMEEHEIPIKEYTGNPPFVTLADLMPEDKYEYEIFMRGLADTVREWDDWLSPVNFDWEENARITGESGMVLEGSLYVDYHETVSPWIANVLAKEYHRIDKRSKYYELLDMPELDADYAALYYGEFRDITLIIQKGKKIIHAELMQTSRYKVPIEEWVREVAKSLD